MTQKMTRSGKIAGWALVAGATSAKHSTSRLIRAFGERTRPLVCSFRRPAGNTFLVMPYLSLIIGEAPVPLANGLEMQAE